jgi:LacI family transcriptional regulator/LacI family repressor for deo operon, udp, cdd, tsx, nupC, and nupG
VVEGIERVAREAGYSVFLSSSHNNPVQEMIVAETFQRRRVDAIIVTSSRVGSLYSSQLDRMQVPIVLVNNQEDGEYLYSVAVDDIQGAQLAVEHLLALGHRRIGYIGAVDRPYSNRRRLAGYMAALEQAEISPEAALMLAAPARNDLERGAAALQPFRAAQATAVFCYNDLTAIGLMVAGQQQGLAIPQELSVVGFDDIEAALYVTPPLTTVRQPRLVLGELAMSMVLNLLAGQPAQDQVLTCELIVRGSTRLACEPKLKVAAEGPLQA